MDGLLAVYLQLHTWSCTSARRIKRNPSHARAALMNDWYMRCSWNSDRFVCFQLMR